MDSKGALASVGLTPIEVLKSMPPGGPQKEVHLCRRRNDEKVVAKVGDSERNRFILNEYKVLSCLENLPHRTFGVPRVYDVILTQDSSLLIMDYIEPRKRPGQLEDVTVLEMLLGKLHDLPDGLPLTSFSRPTDPSGFQDHLKSPHCRALFAHYWDSANWFGDALDLLRVNHRKVLTHNDFAIENIIFGKCPADGAEKWFMLDWEHAGYSSEYCDAACATLWHARQQTIANTGVRHQVMPWEDVLFKKFLGNKDASLNRKAQFCAYIVNLLFEKLDYHYKYGHEHFDQFQQIINYYETALWESTTIL